MQAFLAKLLATIVPVVLNWFYAFFKKKVAERQAENAIEEKNKTAREKAEKAETPVEREDAAKDIARNF